MSHDTAVQFATNSRIHIGLAVKNLAESVAFYTTLFAQQPTKIRPSYAKFEVVEPPVNLALNEVGGQTGPCNAVAHFGIQLKTVAGVQAAGAKLAAGGLASRVEEQVSCCYAVQNKIWTTDPDGNHWEVYVVLDDQTASHASNQGPCCDDQCCPDQRLLAKAGQRQAPAVACCTP